MRDLCDTICVTRPGIVNIFSPVEFVMKEGHGSPRKFVDLYQALSRKDIEIELPSTDRYEILIQPFPGEQGCRVVKHRGVSNLYWLFDTPLDGTEVIAPIWVRIWESRLSIMPAKVLVRHAWGLLGLRVLFEGAKSRKCAFRAMLEDRVFREMIEGNWHTFEVKQRTNEIGVIYILE